jgi:predicted TIM-barrel fold metal-dependent hydrolase
MSTKPDVGHVPLVDHHCHGLVTGQPDRAGFEDLITESSWAGPRGTTFFDTQLGFAVRRWCAPLLDLEPHCDPEDYLARRADLGVPEVDRRLMQAAGIDTFLIETGYRGDDILTPSQMSALTGRTVKTVVRLERVAETLAETGTTPSSFGDDYAAALAIASAGAVGLKSIMAYRFGLDFDPARPEAQEVEAAAARWLSAIDASAGARLDDPILLRHVLWAGVDTGLPIQFHVGYGDPDVELHRCNPLHMTRWLHAVRALGTDVLLLHCYPYQREAGYLAHVFPHVYCDVGLAINYTGSRSGTVIAESLELTPFHKALFSSDAFGLAELYLLGARLFRRGLGRCLDTWIDDGDWTIADALRVAHLIGHGNAERVYGLGSHD